MIREAGLFLNPPDAFDPYLNLATEEALLQSLRPGQVILYLWQNRDTVVIGKHQNCYQECRVSLLEQEGGHLARRLSGGGAVFHDLGNLNYTFLAMRKDYDVAAQTGLILEAVRSFGIDAAATGRNDIEACGRKFSGNAYYKTSGACYQHGTLLVAADAAKMTGYLQVDREKLQSKGVQSVRSRVIGLRELCPEITVGALRQRLAEVFLHHYAQLGAETGVLSDTAEAERIRQSAAALRSKYASPEWIYGQRNQYAYEFGRRFAWGNVQIKLDVKDGCVAAADVYTDSLLIEWPGKVRSALTGVRFAPEPVSAALSQIQPDVEETDILRDVKILIEESM